MQKMNNDNDKNDDDMALKNNIQLDPTIDSYECCCPYPVVISTDNHHNNNNTNVSQQQQEEETVTSKPKVKEHTKQQQHKQHQRLQLLLHCTDGVIPYLTPLLLQQAFPMEKINDIFSIGIAVKDTCIVPIYSLQKPPPTNTANTNTTGNYDECIIPVVDTNVQLQLDDPTTTTSASTVLSKKKQKKMEKKKANQLKRIVHQQQQQNQSIVVGGSTTTTTNTNDDDDDDRMEVTSSTLTSTTTIPPPNQDPTATTNTNTIVERTKPRGYEYSSNIPIDSWLLPYRRIMVPTFDLIADTVQATTTTKTKANITTLTKNMKSNKPISTDSIIPDDPGVDNHSNDMMMTQLLHHYKDETYYQSTVTQSCFHSSYNNNNHNHNNNKNHHHHSTNTTTNNNSNKSAAINLWTPNGRHPITLTTFNQIVMNYHDTNNNMTMIPLFHELFPLYNHHTINDMNKNDNINNSEDDNNKVVVDDDDNNKKKNNDIHKRKRRKWKDWMIHYNMSSTEELLHAYHTRYNNNDNDKTEESTRTDVSGGGSVSASTTEETNTKDIWIPINVTTDTDFINDPIDHLYLQWVLNKLIVVNNNNNNNNSSKNDDFYTTTTTSTGVGDDNSTTTSTTTTGDKFVVSSSSACRVSGIVLIGWQYIESSKHRLHILCTLRDIIQSRLLDSTYNHQHPTTTKITIAILSIVSFQQILEIVSCMKSTTTPTTTSLSSLDNKDVIHYVMGTNLPTIWAKSKVAFVGNGDNNTHHQTQTGQKNNETNQNGTSNVVGNEMNETNHLKRRRVESMEDNTLKDNNNNMNNDDKKEEGHENEYCIPLHPLSKVQDHPWFRDQQAIVPNCQCLTCLSHTRSYIYHLVCANELLSEILLFIHNLHHLLEFVRCQT